MAEYNAAVERMNIEVSEEALEDLRNRLKRRRKPNAPPKSRRGGDSALWQSGTNADSLEDLLEYWENEYNWKDAEAKLNQLDNFCTAIDNVNVHFIHQKNDNPDAIPLLLVHGWPGSVYEFNELIPMLMADLDHPFHIVAPSLPGYGWSEIKDGTGIDCLKTADIFNRLMVRLGYEHYAVQGGDWGSMVTSTMARQFGDRVAALHLNMVPSVPIYDLSARSFYQRFLMMRDTLLPNVFLNETDKLHFDRLFDYIKNGSSYMVMHSTKPQMLAVGFNDSPVALASWFLEKYFEWTDRAGGEYPGLSKFDMVTNLCIYWFTETIGSSMRFYLETIPKLKTSISFCSVPTGVAAFPQEIILPPKEWVAAAYNLKHWTEFSHGGHFAAWERPKALKTELQVYFHHVIDFDKCKKLCHLRKPGDEVDDKVVPKRTMAAIALAGACTVLYGAISRL